MIPFDAGKDDAFVAWVARLVNGVVRTVRPTAVRVIEIDHWFDQKWLGFSGKAVGAVAIWKAELTVPPFHPHRVKSERQYVRLGDAPDYVAASTAPPLHRAQPSGRNLRRRIADLAPATGCFWHSGDGTRVGRGAVMAYLPSAEGAWYVGVTYKSGCWLPTTLAGITPRALETFENAART